MSGASTNCPRCGTICSLITDSCGHHKCRNCLIADANGCLECKQEEEQKSQSAPAIIESQNINEGDDSIKVTNRKKTVSTPWPAHIETVQTSTGPQHHCTICRKKFGSRTQQYYHLGCANEAAKKYKCGHCDKSFSSRSHLNYHLESHVQIFLHCTQCSKTFTNKIVLKKHQKLHQLTPVDCPECGKVFRCKQSLEAHLEWHQNNLSFQCSVCEHKFSLQSRLNQHMLTHLEKTHECSECGKRFHRNSTLQLHSKVHLKIKNYVCTICFRRFCNSQNLSRHVKLHEGAVKYRCIQCDINTIRKDNMLRHVRNMHPGELFEECIETLTTVGTTRDDNDGDKELSTVGDATNIPKTIENSSVIKCVGNVEPVKIPNVHIENIEFTDIQTKEPPATLRTLDNMIVNNNETAGITQNKFKKRYDPIEMYRKILISDDEDVEEEESDIQNVAAEKASATAVDHGTEKPLEFQRATINTSNFSEMHWRKNFKYTYEYQEY